MTAPDHSLPSSFSSEEPPRPSVELPALVAERLKQTADFYDQHPTRLNSLSAGYRRLLAKYYRYIIPATASVLEVGCGAGDLLALLPNQDVEGIDCSAEQIAQAKSKVPHGRFWVASGEALKSQRTYDFIILSETVNLAADVQLLLQQLQAVSNPSTRLICNFYSSVWRPVLALATALGFRAQSPPSNWLSSADVRNLCDLSDWQMIKMTSRLLCPVTIPVVSTFLNRYIAPWLPWLCLTVFGIARPRRRSIDPTNREGTVSVVVPARNEAGNVEHAVLRTPRMGAHTEIIFIEGNSTDDTWEAIERTAAAHPECTIRTMRQSGKGKGNAVREAFAAAKGDILMILDADLTMPPEELPKFYDALVSGHAEFANGVRLVYPMEQRAMQFLNLCANKSFGIIFSWLLGQPIKDTLCGTKVLWRSDYEKIAANRAYFGSFDPFGDFDLLFGADKLNLKIADIPIHYRERTYGSTNIQRWRHGLLLLRMVVFAARKLKFV